MKIYLISILISLVFCFANNSTMNAQNANNRTILYPTEAFAIKYGQTIKIPDLSGLPVFSATYDPISNIVTVRKGDRRLTLNQSNKTYYKSGKYGSLQYSMDATVNNGVVSQIIYLETEDNVTVKIIYRYK